MGNRTLILMLICWLSLRTFSWREKCFMKPLTAEWVSKAEGDFSIGA